MFWIIWTKRLGDLKRCHTSKSCTLCLISMTFELNIKCLRQHPATGDHLEMTKTEWSEISDPVVITAHSSRHLQPGNRKNPTKPRTEMLTNLVSVLQKFTKFPHFKNTDPPTRQFAKKLIRQCQSFVSGNQTTSPKRNKTNCIWPSSMVEVNYFHILIWHFFGDTGSIPAPFIKIFIVEIFFIKIFKKTF